MPFFPPSHPTKNGIEYYLETTLPGGFCTFQIYISLKYDEKENIVQHYINILLEQRFAPNKTELSFSRYLRMQNIPNRMFMERFLRFNNGNLVDVLPWKPCTQENPVNQLKQIENAMLFIAMQAE